LFVFWVVIFFVLGLLLGLAAGYFGYRQINHYIAGAPIPIEASYEDDDADDLDTDTIASATAATASDDAVVAKAEPEQKEPRYDTITSTCFLTTLARKYYGQMDYWVYIYDANNLGNPNLIGPGTKVRIPYPEELNLTGNTETDLKAAKQRASVIYAKYKR
jgi:nucleoid-associated protein YgaU